MIYLRSLLFTVILGTLLASGLRSQGDTLRQVKQDAFRPGEKLEYKIHYGMITAGRAEIRVDGPTRLDGRPVYHAVGSGRSVGMAEWFFRTRDHYESYIDTSALVPWKFIRDVDEGGYTINRRLLFDQYRQQVHNPLDPGKGTFELPAYTQDLFSAFYYARSLRTDTLQPGDVIRFPVFLDYEIFPFNLKLVARKPLKTDWGRISCMVFQPAVQEGRVFEDDESVEVWISDDGNKIPLLIKSELVVGNLKVSLTGFEGLSHPLGQH